MSSDEPSRPIPPTPTSYASAVVLWFDWACQWIAYWAGNLAVFRVLEYAGKLGVLVAVIFWIADYPERQRTAIRTAWSVVNEKGGGREENLEYLAGHQVELKGLNGASGYFAGIVLNSRDLSWSDLDDANFENAKLDKTKLQGSTLSGTSFKNASLIHTNFRYARLYPRAPNFEGADIDGADFHDITISDANVYRNFAAARNWQTALFDKNTRRMVECMANASTALSGCGPDVPELFPTDPEQGQLLAEAIIYSIHCEVADAVIYIIDEDRRLAKLNGRRIAEWLDQWGTQITLTLTAEDSTGTLSSNAIRTDILNYYYTVPDLHKHGSCAPGFQRQLPTTSLIKSDLKLKEWLVYQLPNMSPDIAAGPFGKNAISHEVNFQVVSSGGSATTSLKPTNSKFISAHHLLITFGPVDPSQGGLVGAASNAHLASQIGLAVSTDVKGSIMPVDTAR